MHNNQIPYAKVKQSMHEVCNYVQQCTCRFIELTKFITNRRQQPEQPPPISRLVRRLKTFRSANHYMYPVIKYHVCNYKNAYIKSITCLQ